MPREIKQTLQAKRLAEYTRHVREGKAHCFVVITAFMRGGQPALGISQSDEPHASMLTNAAARLRRGPITLSAPAVPAIPFCQAERRARLHFPGWPLSFLDGERSVSGGGNIAQGILCLPNVCSEFSYADIFYTHTHTHLPQNVSISSWHFIFLPGFCFP